MRIILTWLRLESRRRWRSLLVLALLVALATTAVLAAVAGARRGQTAYDRLAARTLPATIAVLPNQPGFDWSKVRALPEVSVLTTFVISSFVVDGYPEADVGFPPADSQIMRTIERPVVFEGRLFNPDRPDEVVVTPQFQASYGKGVGDTLTLHLASPRQIDEAYDPSTGGPPRGPQIRARIVGLVRGPWFLYGVASKGAVLPSPGLLTHYRANIMGTNGQTYAGIKGGQAFRFGPTPRPEELQEVKDVAVLPLVLSGFLALLALGAVGHALAIAVRRRRSELAVLRALGMTRRQSRLVVTTQATVLALIGLVFGVPLGIALGRALWRVVADGTPLAYHPPLAAWALLLIGPLALVAANLLAAWPGQRAARLRTGQILRTE